MNIRQKAMYLLSLAALPLGAHGCKKTVFPPQEPNIDPTELTTDTTGQIKPYVEPYDMTIPWSWDSCRIGPHWDLINYYLFDDACVSLHLVPDSTDSSSVWHSTYEIPELWERVADTLEAIDQRSQGKLTLNGAVVYVKEFVPDSVPSPTIRSGIYQKTAKRFNQLGITVKPEEGKTARPANARKSISWQKLTPKVVRAKNAKNNGHYTRVVTFGWNDYRYGPVAGHFEAYIRDPNCDSVIFVPDSSIYSTISAVGNYGAEDWDKIAKAFYEYTQRAPGKIKFAGEICYRTGWMYPGTKELFESLGFRTVEYQGIPGLDGAKKQEAMPWNQAQQMLQNKSR